MRWPVVLSCAVALCLPLAPARATIQGDYLQIYLKLNDSERLERDGDYRGALEGFEDCYQKLRKIHLNNPDWESVLVTSRMDDCKAKIAELEPKVDAAGAVAPPAIAPETAQTPAPPSAGLEDTATLKERLQQVENELAATKQQLEEVSAKYKATTLEEQTLHTELDSVNQQLAALKQSQSVDENMGQLLAQNKELTQKLADATLQIKTLTGPRSGRSARLMEQLKAVQAKLDASEAANAGLTANATTLQQQLTQAQNDLTTANQKLAASGPGTPEYLTLKHENEVMRGLLTREIQEQARRDGAKRLAQEEFDRLKINSKVLQEQIDIGMSPTVAPTNDEERELLAQLKTGSGGVMPMTETSNGNQLSATTSGTAVTEANPPSVPAPTDTNTVTAPATDTNTLTAAMPGTTNTPPAPPAADTNATAATPPPASQPTDTNAAPNLTQPPAISINTSGSAPATNVAPPGPSTAAADTNAAPATTSAAPSVATETNAAPPAPPPPTPPPSVATTTNAAPAVDTNATAATPSTATGAAPGAAATETNAAPAAANAAPAVASTDTNAAPAAGTAAADKNYSYKPRLPDDMREVAQEATDLFKMQRYDEAAAKYQMIIDKYPESLYAWSNLGVVRSQEGKLQEAMKALQQAVKLSPNDAFSYRNLGIVYYQLNQNDAAIDALERSIALDPNNVYSHDYLGCATSQKGWQEVAEREFRKAIEINDDFPDAHYNLAIVYAMQKPPALELARREYKRALELGLPRDPRLEKLLGL